MSRHPRTTSALTLVVCGVFALAVAGAAVVDGLTLRGQSVATASDFSTEVSDVTVGSPDQDPARVSTSPTPEPRVPETSEQSAGESPSPAPRFADVQAGPATPTEPSAPAVPVRLGIPGIDVEADVVPVGVAADGQMEIPSDGDDIGWYRFGPDPTGDVGSTVLASHVATPDGWGVLSRLGDLRAGDEIVLSTDEGERRYVVQSRRTVPKTELDTAELFSRDGPARLMVVTCGGPWLPETGAHRDNIIVQAVPVNP